MSASDPQKEESLDEPEFPDLVTIRKFDELLDASLAKGSLESAGIEAFLAGTYTIGHVAPVELQVQRSDVEAAKEILDAPIPESFDVEGEGKFEQPRCPFCGSIDVSFDDAPVGGPLQARPDSGWKCQACQQVWPSE